MEVLALHPFRCFPDSLWGGVLHERSQQCQTMMHWLKCQVVFSSLTRGPFCTAMKTSRTFSIYWSCWLWLFHVWSENTRRQSFSVSLKIFKQFQHTSVFIFYSKLNLNPELSLTLLNPCFLSPCFPQQSVRLYPSRRSSFISFCSSFKSSTVFSTWTLWCEVFPYHSTDLSSSLLHFFFPSISAQKLPLLTAER